jgi:hypothetical protein
MVADPKEGLFGVLHSCRIEVFGTEAIIDRDDDTMCAW